MLSSPSPALIFHRIWESVQLSIHFLGLLVIGEQGMKRNEQSRQVHYLATCSMF